MAVLGVYYVFHNRDGESASFQMENESAPHWEKGVHNLSLYRKVD